jgi:hypothetical protein
VNVSRLRRAKAADCCNFAADIVADSCCFVAVSLLLFRCSAAVIAADKTAKSTRLQAVGALADFF